MSRFARLSKFVKFEEGADDQAVKQAVLSMMDDEAAMALAGGDFPHGEHADQLEQMAEAYEAAKFDDAADGDEPPHAVMRKMAAKFRKMEEAKMAAPKDEPVMAEKKEDEETEAKMAVMEATNKSLRDRLAKLERAEEAREAAAKAEKELTFEALADQAIAGGYPKAARGALVKFARVDFEGARESVSHLLPKGGTPVALFDRLSQNGAPVGKDGREVSDVVPAKSRKVQAMGRTFVEDDYALAMEIRKVAESTDPAVKAKVDAKLSERERPQMYSRLLAAEKIVKAERPELAEAFAE